MNLSNINRRSMKSVQEALKYLDRRNGYDGVTPTKNDAVVIHCFMFAMKIKEADLGVLESWREKLDPTENNDTTDHIRAGKALEYTISCVKAGEDPDPEKILKLGGYMEEGSGNE